MSGNKPSHAELWAEYLQGIGRGVKPDINEHPELPKPSVNQPKNG